MIKLSELLSEDVSKILTKLDLLNFKPGDRFVRDNGISKVECEVIENSKKELTYKCEIPGLGLSKGSIIYKNFNDRRNTESHKTTHGLSIFRYYSL